MNGPLRSLAVVVLLVVSGVLLLLGGAGVYAQRELVDEARFSDRLAGAVRDADVQAVFARRVAEAVEAARPDLIAFRPVITSAAKSVARSRQFQAEVRAAAAELHASVFDPDRSAATLRVSGAGLLVADAVRRIRPELAKRIPAAVEARSASLATVRKRAIDAAEQVKRFASAGPFALVLAALAMLTALLLAPTPRARLAGAGLTVAAAGGAGTLVLALSRSEVLDRVAGGGQTRAAAGAVWDAYLGGLRGWCLAALACGLVVAGAALIVRGQRAPARMPRARALALAAAVAGLLVVAALGARSLATPEGPRFANEGCNGHRALCDRRLDAVAIPATHNSMAAADEPGWFFAQQESGIGNQLAEGIRGLLIDTHYGVQTPRGVKTDLEAEGSTREKLVAEVGEPFVRAAERLRGRIGYTGDSKPAVYLCHGACEVGSTPVVPALEQIRDFAVRHPREVIVISIQDAVTPADTVDAFRRSGLLPLVYEGRSGPPWPTLGELVDSGRRIVVFGENHTGDVPWYRPQFELMQETPFGFRSTAALEAPASCDENRGQRDAALFLMNHWVDTPPANKPSNARTVNARDVLLRRARACQAKRDRLPNLLAVDFYRTGDVVGAANELNGFGSR